MANTFIYPFYQAGHQSSSYYGNVVVWPVGSSQTIKWNTTLEGYYVGLYHQLLDKPGGSGVEVARLKVFGQGEGSGVQEFEWQVSTEGSSLAESPVWFMWVSPGPNGIPSSYFNMTESSQNSAPATSSAVATTIRENTNNNPTLATTIVAPTTPSINQPLTTSSVVNTTPQAVASVAHSGGSSMTTSTSARQSLSSTFSTDTGTSSPTASPAPASPTSTSTSIPLTITLGVGLGVGIPLLLIVGVLIGMYVTKRRRRNANNHYGFRNSRLWRAPDDGRRMTKNNYESADHVKYNGWSHAHGQYGKPRIEIYEAPDKDRCEAPEQVRMPVELPTGPYER